MLFSTTAILAIGIVVSLLLAFLALERALRRNDKPRLFLSGFLIITALYFVATNVLQVGVSDWPLLFRWLKIPLALAMVPSFYLFARQLISSHPSPKHHLFLHAVPSLLVLLLNLPILWAPGTAGLKQASPVGWWINLINQHVVFAILFLQMVGYTLRLMLRYPRYTVMFEQWYSTVPRHHQLRFRWLITLFFGFYLLLDTYLVGLIIDLSRYQQYYTALLVAFVPLMGWLGMEIEMLPRPANHNGEKPTALVDNAHQDNIVPETLNHDRQAALLSSEQKAALFARLNTYLEQHEPYCNPQLSLADLAQALETNSKYLSAVINEHCGCNFFSLINSRRVAKVQQLMNNEAYRGYSLLGLAQTAGFNSKSAFIAAFKRHTGLTPSAWAAQNAPHIAK